MAQDSPSSKAIVFVTLSYAPVIGGAEKQAQLLLERWAHSGQEIWVLTRRVRGCPRYEVINGVKVYRLWSLWLPILSWLTFTLGVLLFLFPRGQRIRSLWGLMLNVTTLAVVTASQIFGRPAVIKLSSSGEGGNLQMMLRSLVGGWMLHLLRSCQYLIVLNSETVEELQPYDIASKKIKRIPNGVDTNFFQPVGPEERRNLRDCIGLKEDHLGILFVGRLEKGKNLENLLAIWPAIYERCPHARLLLVGEGAEEAALKLWSRTHQLEESVWFLGVRSDVVRLYQACDLFILPSVFEGLSNALLEAMACQMPVVVSQTAGNTNVVSSGKEGICINLQDPKEWVDPIVQLVKNERRRAAFGQEARRTVQARYSIDSVLGEYQALSQLLDQELEEEERRAEQYVSGKT